MLYVVPITKAAEVLLVTEITSGLDVVPPSDLSCQVEPPSVEYTYVVIGAPPSVAGVENATESCVGVPTEGEIEVIVGGLGEPGITTPDELDGVEGPNAFIEETRKT